MDRRTVCALKDVPTPIGWRDTTDYEAEERTMLTHGLEQAIA